MTWAISHKYDVNGARLADGHYSRRTVGSPQFMPPGETVVLISACGLAVFGWWRPSPRSGLVAMNGRDGWTCSIFRNTSTHLSSALILEAETLLARLTAQGETHGPCGPDGMLTYVWPRKVASANPGYCFKRAGWTRIGESKAKGARLKLLFAKPFALAGVLVDANPAMDAAAKRADALKRDASSWSGK